MSTMEFMHLRKLLIAQDTVKRILAQTSASLYERYHDALSKNGA